jgi:micrococcal nuclease
MTRPALLLLLLCLLTTSALAAPPAKLTGKVVSVHDGDTLTVLDAAKTKRKIRLHGIDAPESKQPFGNVAKKALADLVFGKEVDVEVVDKDRYGREVGNVHVDGVHVNREQVANGLAWRYVQYDKRGEFTQVEQAARAARKGLWADAHPVAPWDWRKGEKERRAAR